MLSFSLQITERTEKEEPTSPSSSMMTDVIPSNSAPIPSGSNINKISSSQPSTVECGKCGSLVLTAVNSRAGVGAWMAFALCICCGYNIRVQYKACIIKWWCYAPAVLDASTAVAWFHFASARAKCIPIHVQSASTGWASTQEFVLLNKTGHSTEEERSDYVSVRWKEGPKNI